MTPGAEAVATRVIEVDGHRLDLTVHNFNIAEPSWPLEGSFDTILFFETLEHVDRDPSGVMLNVTHRMTRDSTLVISVPNAVSYKTLQEFMTGAPPWTYWFFHPDLSHEPRHSFEYTPIFFMILLRSAGLTERAFRTISAYAEPEAIADIFEIGGALSVEPSLFGETIIAQARKTHDEPLFRYPDCIYDGDRYYRSTYPVLSPRLDLARRAFFDRTRAIQAEAQAARHAQSEAQTQASEAEERVRNAERRARDAAVASREAMFLCDGYLAKLNEVAEEVRRAEARVREAEERVREREAWALESESEAAEEVRRAEARVREREAWALESERLYNEIRNSTFWRVTGPIRRLGGQFPRTTKRVRTVLATPVRLYRHLASVVRTR